MKKILIFGILIFILGVGAGVAINEAIKAQRLCQGDDFLAVDTRLPPEEDPQGFFQQLNQEPQRIEYLPEEQYVAVMRDRETNRLIIIDFVEINQIIGGCLKASREALQRTKGITTGNKDRIYYRQIRSVKEKGMDFLEIIVILRPTGNRN